MTFRELDNGVKLKLVDDKEFTDVYTKLKRIVRRGSPRNCYDDDNFLFCKDSTIVEVVK